MLFTRSSPEPFGVYTRFVKWVYQNGCDLEGVEKAIPPPPYSLLKAMTVDEPNEILRGNPSEEEFHNAMKEYLPSQAEQSPTKDLIH